MKMIISIVIIAALPLLSFSQSKSISALQNKYQDKSNCFTLTLNGDILNALSGSERAVAGAKGHASENQSLKILFVTKKAEGYSHRDLKRLKNEIKRQSFEEVMSVKSKNGNINVVIKKRDGKMSEFVMLIDDINEGFAMLNFNGSVPE